MTLISAAQGAQSGDPTATVRAVQTLLPDAAIGSNAFSFTLWYPTSIQAVVGVLLTWFAVLQGAPFWFDVLKRIVPVRLTGAKPDAQAAQGDQQAVVPRLTETYATPQTV